jgi:hypothetical protein
MAAEEHGLGMSPRICRCCGEQIAEQGNQLSRNPNVCASCSSMMDGMDASRVEEPSPNRQQIERETVSIEDPSSLLHIFD